MAVSVALNYAEFDALSLQPNEGVYILLYTIRFNKLGLIKHTGKTY